MEQALNNTRVIILAAGDGTRMKSELPKVMHLLKGKPLIDFVVRAAEGAGFGKPVVVTSAKHNLVEDYLENRAEFVKQPDPKGTGHAVQVAVEAIKSTKNIVVVYGDMPFLKSETIQKLSAAQANTQSAIALGTVTVTDFNEWRSALADFGRIIRGVNGMVSKIVEKKDATAEELKSKELNPAYFCFDISWLKNAITKIIPHNAQKEYYLTDLVEIALAEHKLIETVPVDARQAVGINTIEGLNVAETL